MKNSHQTERKGYFQ